MTRRTRSRRRRASARGGQGGWEPRGRIQARATRVVELAIQGRTQHDIATDVQISQAAVSKILARADARALHELSDQGARQRVRQTQRLERLYAEAAHAWEQSKVDATRRRQRKSETDGSGPGSAQTVAEVIVESQHGDARYLDACRKTLADLRKLWGLDAPQQLDLHDARRAYDHLTEAELLERLARQEPLLRSAPPPRGGQGGRS